MKRFMFALMLLLIALSSLFAQEKTLRRYELSGHSPKEGIYKRFFGGYSYERKPIQELRIKQSENSDDIWVMADFGGAKFDKYAEEEVEKTPMTNGKKSTIYTYSFPGTPITMSIIEVYTIATKNTECMICFKSYNEVIYFAKAKRIPMTKEQIAKEKKEAEEAKKKLEEQRKQEEAKQVKKQKEVEKILAIYQETDIKSKATDYLNTKYAKQIKECERKLEKLVLNYARDVNILLCGDSTGINIVKVDEDIVNDELNNLQPSSTIFCTLNGENYYKCQDKIFFTKKIHVETKKFEHGYSGLKNRGGTFQYYGNILDMVKKACEQNFIKRGEYFFEYSIIGDEVIVKELILERKQRDEIRGKKTIGRKILTIGGSVVLLGVIAACSAL